MYTAWGGFAYGRGLDGREAVDDMNRQYRRIAVAAKNTDTREHDIADSDDYFQYHGGMVATVRALTGQDPDRLLIVEVNPNLPRTKSLPPEYDNTISLDLVDVLVETNATPFALTEPPTDEVDGAIASG